jgi:hypothetical protein
MTKATNATQPADRISSTNAILKPSVLLLAAPVAVDEGCFSGGGFG